MAYRSFKRYVLVTHNLKLLYIYTGIFIHNFLWISPPASAERLHIYTVLCITCIINRVLWITSLASFMPVLDDSYSHLRTILIKQVSCQYAKSARVRIILICISSTKKFTSKVRAISEID